MYSAEISASELAVLLAVVLIGLRRAFGAAKILPNFPSAAIADYCKRLQHNPLFINPSSLRGPPHMSQIFMPGGDGKGRK